MKKTLDEIINRQDYVRVSEQLREKAVEIAHLICAKMEELDEDEIGNDMQKSTGCIVRICKRVSNGSSERFLAIKSCDGYGGYTYHSLEAIRSYYFYGDFNCWVERATNKEILRFMNNAGALLEGLGEIETNKVDEANKALEATKDIKTA